MRTQCVLPTKSFSGQGVAKGCSQIKGRKMSDSSRVPRTRGLSNCVSVRTERKTNDTPPRSQLSTKTNAQPTNIQQPINQTPTRMATKNRRSTDVANNPHLLTPPDESVLDKKKRHARAFNSRMRRKNSEAISELSCNWFECVSFILC